MKITTKLIAEIGSNHNRSLKRCFKIIDEAKNLGFYAVKFQLFKIDKLFSKEAKNTYKIISKKGKENYQSVIYPNYINIVKKNIKFSCTPFDLKSVEILKPYVDFYKIASYEMNWTPLLEACAKTKNQLFFQPVWQHFLRSIKHIKRYLNIIKK